MGSPQLEQVRFQGPGRVCELEALLSSSVQNVPRPGAPGWLSRVSCPPLVWAVVMISGSGDHSVQGAPQPHLALHSGKSLLDSPSPSLSLLTLSQINKLMRSFFKDLFIYLFMIDIERERGRDKGGGRSRLHAGSPTRDSRIKPWAKGRRQTAAPPRDP